MRCYVINLASETQRLAHMAALLDRLGADWTRFAARDVRDWTAADLAAYRADRAGTARPYEWFPGQIGALLSHMDVWRLIGTGTDDWGVVFEDDVHLDPAMATILANSDWIPPDQDIVRFETTRQGMRLGPALPSALPPPFTVRSVTDGAWGAAGYAIRRETALFLSHTPPRLQAPVDWLLFHGPSTLASQLNTLQFHPAPCVQDQYLDDPTRKIGFVSGTEPDKPLDRDLRQSLRFSTAKVVRPLLGKQAVPYSVD